MDEWNKLYQRNCVLDQHYIDKYSKTEPLFFEKNCLGLLVELGECANETKCFKYWTIKEAKRDEVLEEYADCVMMTLCIFNHLNLDHVEVCAVESFDLLESFRFLFEQASLLMKDCTKERVVTIFSTLLALGSLLGFDEQEMLDACYKKIEKCEERLQSDY